MSNKINFALVGCGRISGKHTDAIVNHLSKIASLVAVCDIRLERAAAIGEKFKIPYYSSYDAMLQEHPEIQVVNILTESGNHGKHTVDIINKYKKHVVVEKPMALTLKDADMMIQASQNNNVNLFVVKQNRYNLPVTKLREAIEQGRFGRIVMGTVRVRWCRRQDYYDMDAWRGTWSMDGGVFTNQASHHIDLLLWMIGEPVSVFAKSRTALVNIETEDTGIAIIQFRNGALGLVEATTATRPKDLEGSISILGENGTVEIGGFAVNEIKTWSFSPELPEDKNIIEHYRENPQNVYGFGHIKYLENVCNVLLHNHKPLVDGFEGRKSIELINAIYESIQTGKEIYIKFHSCKSKLGSQVC